MYKLKTALTGMLLVLFLAGCSTLASSAPGTAGEGISGTASATLTTKPTANPTPLADLTLQPATAGLDESPSPHKTSTPPPSPTTIPQVRQLTSGGCCVEPMWSPDSQRVLFIDRPSVNDPSGLWGVEVTGSEPQFVTNQLGIFSADMQLRAYPQAGGTFVEKLSSGEIWRIPNGGRAVNFSPDNAWVAWTAGQSGPPFDTAVREVWISRVDGREAQMIFSGIRAGFEGWLPNGDVLVSGLGDGPGSDQVLWRLNRTQNQTGQANLLELGRGGRLREITISPQGAWVAYLTTFSADPTLDGLWLADTASGERRPLEPFGGYQWRRENQLLVVPLDLSQTNHQLIQIDLETAQATTLTDPAVTPIKIANGDWSVSPDGQKIVFVSAEDGNLWLLELPE